MKTNQLMLDMKIIAVCPEINTEHRNALCRPDRLHFCVWRILNFLMLNLVIPKVTIGS
jgi:hypothetical protein